jgi:shikimate dehydrogenase
MGDPIAGNPTQYMLEKAFAVADLDWRFLTFEVPAQDFEAALRGARIFDFRGVMLAKPHRGQVHQYVESKTDAARLSGQINCLERRGKELRGHNTEGQALRRLVDGRVALKGAAATILGSGRLVKSIVAELALAGAAAIEIICLEPAQASPLIQTLRDDPQTASVDYRVTPWPTSGTASVAEASRLLINATPVGRQEPDARLPIDVGGLPAEMLVVDAVYNPPATRLLREARQRGLKTVDGLTLLVEQAAIAFEIWTSRTPDRDAMREAVEEFLVL